MLKRLGPWDESYIDYVEGDSPPPGIINNPEIPITADRLRALNEEGGENQCQHRLFTPLNFLLWGQDQSEGRSGEKDRITDYVDVAERDAARPVSPHRGRKC